MSEPKIKDLNLSIKNRMPKTIGELREALADLPKNMKIKVLGRNVYDDEGVSMCSVIKVFLTIKRVKNGMVAHRACKETNGAEKILVMS